MITRTVSALLVLLLSGAPALGALCAMDCGDAAAARPHDCHEESGPTDGQAMGAGPQSCTHVRYESDPAKAPLIGDAFPLRPGPAAIIPATGDLTAVPVVCHSRDRDGRPALAPASARAFVRPLRV